MLLLLLLAAIVVVLATSHKSSGHTVHGGLRFLKVVEVTNAACPAGQTGQTASVRGDACYRLGDGLTVSKVKRIALRAPQATSSGYSIQIDLLPQDSGRLGSLTGEVAREQQPRNQLAIVVGGKVVSAPQVIEPIPGGVIMITGNFSRTEAQRYVDLIGG
ncbi:hypothetical protein [Actinomadura sp. DC4]|uniref:SecDF P1 head subdomain-containing protein n=1 Tax=Actinomadura sp. DC4 TaxID=3055069 RepID=UPI0025B181E9|nr:hypothetical protein [Actinomadura sp. DC4]MDN3358804.1 hypothetical protein [Actinomadura sp. DC4]